MDTLHPGGGLYLARAAAHVGARMMQGLAPVRRFRARLGLRRPCGIIRFTQPSARDGVACCRSRLLTHAIVCHIGMSRCNRAGCLRAYGVGNALRALDERIAGLEHAVEVDGATRRYGIAQRAFRHNQSHSRGLAVIPLHAALETVRTGHAMLGSNLVPKPGLGSSGSADAGHVDGKPVGVKRIEFVGEPSHTESRGPIRGEDPGGRQARLSCLANCACKSANEFGVESPDRQLGALSHHCRTGSRGCDQIIPILGRNFRVGRTGNVGLRPSISLVHDDAIRVAIRTGCSGFRGGWRPWIRIRDISGEEKSAQQRYGTRQVERRGRGPTFLHAVPVILQRPPGRLAGVQCHFCVSGPVFQRHFSGQCGRLRNLPQASNRREL
jgi:hypothetical protein